MAHGINGTENFQGHSIREQKNRPRAWHGVDGKISPNFHLLWWAGQPWSHRGWRGPWEASVQNRARGWGDPKSWLCLGHLGMSRDPRRPWAKVQAPSQPTSVPLEPLLFHLRAATPPSPLCIRVCACLCVPWPLLSPCEAAPSSPGIPLLSRPKKTQFPQCFLAWEHCMCTAYYIPDLLP